MKRHVLVMILALAMVQPLLGADRVTVQFTGTVTSIDDPAGVLSAHQIGQAVVGRYTYDLTAPDGDPDPAVGNYVMSTPPNALFVRIGDGRYYPDATSALSVSVSDNQPVTHDTFGFQTGTDGVLNCSATVSALIFRDLTDAAIAGDALLTEAPDLNAFGTSFGFVQGFVCGSGGDTALVRYNIDSVTAIDPNVPTTGEWGLTITALSLAACGTFILRRRRLART